MPFALPVVVEALTRLDRGGPRVGTGSERPDRGPCHGVRSGADSCRQWSRSIPQGYRQPLCAAYRTDALRAALAALGPLAGLPVRALLPRLRRDGMAGARSRPG